MGTDDLPDAYRGHPVKDQHLRYSVLAIWVPNTGWRFTVLWGLAYGLEAAVVAFNRLPLEHSSFSEVDRSFSELERSFSELATGLGIQVGCG